MNLEAQLAGGAAKAGVTETAAAKGRKRMKRTEIPQINTSPRYRQSEAPSIGWWGGCHLPGLRCWLRAGYTFPVGGARKGPLGSIGVYSQ